MVPYQYHIIGGQQELHSSRLQRVYWCASAHSLCGLQNGHFRPTQITSSFPLEIENNILMPFKAFWGPGQSPCQERAKLPTQSLLSGFIISDPQEETLKETLRRPPGSPKALLVLWKLEMPVTCSVCRSLKATSAPWSEQEQQVSTFYRRMVYCWRGYHSFPIKGWAMVQSSSLVSFYFKDSTNNFIFAIFQWILEPVAFFLSHISARSLCIHLYNLLRSFSPL